MSYLFNLLMMPTILFLQRSVPKAKRPSLVYEILSMFSVSYFWSAFNQSCLSAYRSLQVSCYYRTFKFCSDWQRRSKISSLIFFAKVFPVVPRSIHNLRNPDHRDRNWL
jgi:hypothetical protein